MNDSQFFCIINNNAHNYYLGFFKRNYLGFLVPATSPNLSDALKVPFKEEATKIIKALSDSKWVIQEFSV